MIKRACIDCGAYGPHSFVSKSGFALCRRCAVRAHHPPKPSAPTLPKPPGPRLRPSELAERAHARPVRATVGV